MTVHGPSRKWNSRCSRVEKVARGGPNDPGEQANKQTDKKKATVGEKEERARTYGTFRLVQFEFGGGSNRGPCFGTGQARAPLNDKCTSSSTSSSLTCSSCFPFLSTSSAHTVSHCWSFSPFRFGPLPVVPTSKAISKFPAGGYSIDSN